MNNIETMKLALEYLQDNQHLIADNERHAYVMEYGAFIERLCQAIEQAEQKPCLKGGQCKHGSWCSEVYCQEHCEFVEQAEQAQPVAWGVFDVNLHDMFFTEEEAQEMARLKGDGSTVAPLYTATPRQPLTDEQISDLWCKVSNTDFVTADTHEFARAIEAAHGIKGKA